MAGTSASNVWAVGTYAAGGHYKTLIEHWNGRSWNLVASPNPGTGNNLLSVSATSARSAWAVGTYVTNSKQKTLILRWNGRAWNRVPSPSPGQASALDGVAAAGSGVWAVGNIRVGAMTSVLAAHCC